MAHPVLARRAAALLLPLAVLAVPAPASAAPVVTTVDLGTLGGIQAFPSVVNASGQVAGQSQTAADDYRAFFWSNGTMTDLGVAPGGTFSLATGLNDSGQVAGYGDTATGSAGFVWKAGVRTEIAAPGIGQVRTGAINAAGTVLGVDVDTADRRIGFLWRNGVRTDLGTLVPSLINDAGVVVGTVPATNGTYRIVRWDRGVRTDLGTLGVAGSGAPYLVDLTEGGDIAAYASTGTGYKAYVRRAGSPRWVGLGGLRGGDDTRVHALNEVGDAVGISNITPGGVPRAVVWHAGTVYALSTQGGSSSQALDLNDRGDITGSVTRSAGTVATVWRNRVPVTVGPAGADSSAGAINASSQAVGTAYTLDERARGLRWTLTG